jgi:hypothetical protein
MKLFYTILGFIAIATSSYSQDTTFTKIYYIPSTSLTSARVVANHDSGFSTCGILDSEALLINSDSLANIIWSRSISVLSSSLDFNDIIATADSGYITTGNSYKWTTGAHSVLCVKFNHVGDTLWTRSFQTLVDNSGNGTPTRIIETSDSSYVLTWSDPNSNQTMLVKLDAIGNVLWERIVTDIYFYSTAIEAVGDSIIYLAGLNYPDGGAIMKFNSTGDVVWVKNYVDKELSDIVYVNEALYAVYYQSGVGVMKLDTSGAVVWAKKQPLNTGSATITIHADSTFTLQGSYDGWGDGVLKINFDGAVVAHGQYDMFITDVATAKNGGSFILGDGPIYGIKQFEQDHIGVIKTDSLLITSDCYYSFGSPVSTVDNCNIVPLAVTSGNGISEVLLDFQLNLPIVFMDDRCVYATSGLEEVENLSVKVYPNKTDGITYFEFSKVGNYDVWLSTIEGKIIGKTTINGKEGSIDLTLLSGGMYIYSVVDLSGRISGRIIRE